MDLVILILLAVLPIILLIIYINSKDNEKEPKTFLALLFLSGILSCALVVFISFIMGYLFPFFTLGVKNLNFIQLALYVFIGISLVEEGCKWLFTTLIGFRSKNFDEAFDIIVYATFVSLGFACVENILYVIQDGVLSALLRSVTSVPGHMCFGIMMGYHLLLAKISKKNNNKHLYRKNILLSFLIPFIAHGLYDYLLFLNNIFIFILLTIFLIIFFIYSYNKLKQISQINKKIFIKDN